MTDGNRGSILKCKMTRIGGNRARNMSSKEDPCYEEAYGERRWGVYGGKKIRPGPIVVTLLETAKSTRSRGRR